MGKSNINGHVQSLFVCLTRPGHPIPSRRHPLELQLHRAVSAMASSAATRLLQLAPSEAVLCHVTSLPRELKESCSMIDKWGGVWGVSGKCGGINVWYQLKIYIYIVIYVYVCRCLFKIHFNIFTISLYIYIYIYVCVKNVFVYAYQYTYSMVIFLSFMFMILWHMNYT